MYTGRSPTGYAGGMTELEKGHQGRRRGRDARERILSASQQLFRDQGINRTGMDQLCAAARVSKRTAYQHFTGKDELIAEYLRRFDPDVTGGVFDRTDLTPRERLLAAFEVPATGAQDITPMCPYIAASIEIHDPQHPARQYARDYKKSFAARFAETAREAAAAIAAVLIDNAIPTTAPSDDRGSIRSAPVRVAGERQPAQASYTGTSSA